MTRNPRRRTVHHRMNNRRLLLLQTLRFNFVYINGNNLILFFASQINPWSILFFCDSAFFFHSCSQMQISFPSALFILCTLRPFLPRFLINSVSFFSRKIIRHPVKTIFLSFVSIMSCFCMGPIYSVFIHRQCRTLFFSRLNSIIYGAAWYIYILDFRT